MATRTKKTPDMSTVKFLAELLIEKKLDYLRFGDIEIKKSLHFADPIPLVKTEIDPKEKAKLEEAELFQSGV